MGDGAAGAPGDAVVVDELLASRNQDCDGHDGGDVVKSQCFELIAVNEMASQMRFNGGVKANYTSSGNKGWVRYSYSHKEKTRPNRKRSSGKGRNRSSAWFLQTTTRI